MSAQAIQMMRFDYTLAGLELDTVRYIPSATSP
jgi:hypothetical protein